ncbi:MAG: uracil-DNA glycosylase, partial [Vicinamibacteria bacterium]
MSDERALLLADLRERAAYFATLTDLGLPGSAPAPVARAVEPPSAPAAAVKAPPAETLEQIRADLGDCQRCVLAKTRTKIVFGQGNPQARLMFVGEAPGGDEDEQGLAFVGKAGQLLTKIIEAINLKRDDVFIANVLKCRPPGNRNPETDEILSCQP